MTTTYDQVSMTTAAALIIASNANRKQLMIKNMGSDTVYIGDANTVVDTADNANGGYKITMDQILYLDDYTGDVYGICAGGETATIAYVEEDMS